MTLMQFRGVRSGDRITRIGGASKATIIGWSGMNLIVIFDDEDFMIKDNHLKDRPIPRYVHYSDAELLAETWRHYTPGKVIT